jgi:hypothetical protein
MAYYAQKNYSQILGFGPDTIASAGCLLVAIDNILQKNGINTDPVSLNEWFKNHDAFIDGDLLSWTSISLYSPEIKANSPVLHSALPGSDNSIVQFHYQSVQHPWSAPDVPNMIDHYCAVDRVENGQLFIVDSYDGLVKGPTSYESTYHKPVAWVTYAMAQPPAPAPVSRPTPAAPAVAPNLSDTYSVMVPIPGYTNATFAANHVKSNSTVAPGKYYVYRRDYGMINITRVAGQPCWWINPADNVLPAPTAPQTATTAVTPTLPPKPVIAAPAPSNWRASYEPLVQDYFALKTIVIHDLATQQPDVMLNQYDLVHGAGTFTGPDGNNYVRTVDSVKSFSWYGLPIAVLLPEEKALPAIHQMMNNMSFRDQLKISLSHLGGWLDSVFTKK